MEQPQLDALAAQLGALDLPERPCCASTAPGLPNVLRAHNSADTQSSPTDSSSLPSMSSHSLPSPAQQMLPAPGDPGPCPTCLAGATPVSHAVGPSPQDRPAVRAVCTVAPEPSSDINPVSADHARASRGAANDQHNPDHHPDRGETGRPSAQTLDGTWLEAVPGPEVAGTSEAAPMAGTRSRCRGVEHQHSFPRQALPAMPLGQQQPGTAGGDEQALASHPHAVGPSLSLPPLEQQQQRLKQEEGPALVPAQEQQQPERLRLNSSGPRHRSLPSDPDYEVPKGMLTETQVLNTLAQQRQEGKHQQLRVDKYGFIQSTPAADAGQAADAAVAHRASGGVASTSGRLLDARAAGYEGTDLLWLDMLRSWGGQQRRQREQQRLDERAVRRLRKWRKMLGPDGDNLDAYSREHPEKFKRRVRKGIPEQLRGLAWFAMSDGAATSVARRRWRFSRLAGAGENSVEPASAPAGGPAAGPGTTSADRPLKEQHAPDLALHKQGSGSASDHNLSLTAAVQKKHEQEPEPVSEPGALPPLDPAVNTMIMRDLNRTFPNNVYYMQRQGQGQQALYLVLRAYAVLDPGVGYVQGMGFLAAVLLLFMPADWAFWTLVAVMKGPSRWGLHWAGIPWAAPDKQLGVGSRFPGVPWVLRWLYTPGMPGLQCCLYQFKHLLRDAAPRLAKRMEREGVDPAMYATHWFSTAFAYTLPFGHLLRVWDVFLAEGPKTLFRVGLAVLQYSEPRLVKLPFESLLESLSAKNLPTLLPADPDELLRRALRLPVSRRLEQLRDQWEAEQQQQTGGTGRYQTLSEEEARMELARRWQRLKDAGEEAQGHWEEEEHGGRGKEASSSQPGEKAGRRIEQGKEKASAAPGGKRQGLGAAGKVRGILRGKT